MSPVFCACAMCDPLWVMIASTGEKGAKRGMENLENSVVFSVDSGECSEDEEDDIQRKEELQQLLSEQLHDDLLDDSMATSIDGEISVVSSVQYSLSPSERATPDLRTVDSLTPTHGHVMRGNESHDSHMTSSPVAATPPNTPPFHCQHSSDSTVPVQGEEYPHNVYNHNDLEHNPPTTLPGLTQHPLHSAVHGDSSSSVSGLTHYPLNYMHVHAHGGTGHFLPMSTLTQYSPNLGSPTYTSGMTSSNQEIFTQHQPQSEATHHMEELGGEVELTPYDPPDPNSNEDAPVSLDPHIVLEHVPREKSDVFAGTSQAYSAPTNAQHHVHVHEEGYFIRPPNALSREPALESLYTVANHHEGEHYDRQEQDLPATTREMDVLSPSLQQMGLRQLGVLFKARGRHIAELTQQISAQAEDNERHVGILRHEKLLLEKERDQLNVHVGELEAMQESQEKQVSTYQGQLAAEQTKTKALENNKRELLSRLQADEAMIKSLTEQVNELTSSDTLSRVRDGYSSALAQANQQHQQELLTLQQQIGELREEVDKKEEVISQLEGELGEVQSHYESQLVSKDQQLTQKDQQLQQLIKASSQRHTQKQGDGSGCIAQQLDFGVGGDGGGERLVELAAQVEDLTYQLSTAQEELQAATQRAEQAEAIASEQALHLSEVEGDREQFSSNLEELRAELESFKSQVATEKKEALEQCRSACLKLHEESTQRLRDSVEVDKERTKQQHERHIAQLKSDLATVQEQYVALCREKEKLSSKLEEVERENLSSVQAALDKARLEWLQQQEALVKEAVGVAKEEWQEGVELDNRKKVELALKEQEAIWDKRLELEKSQAVALAKEQFSEELAETRRRLEEEQGERLKGGGGSDGEDTGHHQPSSRKKEREEWEREKERAVDEAVKQARAKWMEEREKSLQSRVESAVSTAEKLWKEHHQSQVSRLQQQVSEATPPGPSPSSSVESAVVERALQEAKEKWEEEKQAKIQEALDAAKQKFESKFDMRMELAVTNERGKWEEQSRRAWQEQEQSLLTTAHQEWSKAQESVMKAEVDRARREWERETDKNSQGSVEEAVARTTQHYEGLLKLVRSELVAKHEKEKLTMAGEIRQLEDRVANILKEQQRVSDGGRHYSSGSEIGGGGGGGRPLSQASISEVDLQRLRPLVRTAMTNIKQDMLALLREMQEASNARHQRELAQVREATAREMKHYYLQCLHQLVNSHTTNTNGLHSSDYYFKQQQTGYQPYIPVHPSSSVVENLRPKSQEAYHSGEVGDIRGSTAAMSTQVLKVQQSNSHVQVPAERQTKRRAVSGERRKSTASSPSRKSTSASSSSISPSRTHLSGTSHHHYKTTSSSRKAGVGRLCKNLDAASSASVRHQGVHHTKGGIHHSAVADSGRSGAASSAAVRKDLIGRSSSTGAGKRTGPLSSGLVHSDGVRELKSVTSGKLKTSKR